MNVVKSMWRGSFLIAQLAFLTAKSLSISKEPSPLYISPSETAVLSLLEVFSGSLLTFEVRETECASVSIEPNYDIRELSRSALVESGLKVAATFLTREGVLAVLLSKRTIEVWEIRGLAMKKREGLTTERDIADVKRLCTVDSLAVLYWTVGERGDTWDVFYLNLAASPFQPARVLTELVIPLTSKLVMCSEATNLVIIQEGKSASHYSVTTYSFSSLSSLKKAELSFQNGPILDAICITEVVLLTAEGLYFGAELMLSLSALPIEFGAAEKIGSSRPWSIFTSTGLLVSQGSLTLKFYPGAKFELGKTDAFSDLVLISECGTTYCAIVTSKTSNLQTSFMIELESTWNFGNFQVVSTDIHSEFTHYSLVSIIDKEVVLLGVTFSPAIYATVAHVQDSCTFELCAAERHLHSQPLCTAASVIVTTADITVIPEEPVLLQCHLAATQECEYQVSQWVIGSNLLFAAGDSQVAIRDDELDAREVELEWDASFSDAPPLCISEGLTSVVMTSPDRLTVTLRHLKSSRTSSHSVPAGAVSCVFVGAIAYVLLGNNSILIANELTSASYWSPATNATLIMKPSLSSLFVIAGQDLVEMKHDTVKLSIRLMSNIVSTFSHSNLLLVLTLGEVSAYIDKAILGYQRFAVWSVEDSVIAVAYVYGFLYTYSSAGVLSVYLTKSKISTTLLYQVDMSSTCTFQQFWASSQLLLVCEELIQLVYFSTSKSCFIKAIKTGKEALVNLSTSITILVNRSGRLMLREETFDTIVRPVLAVTVPISPLQDLVTLTSHIIVQSSTGALRTVAISVTARNAGGAVALNKTWENAVLAVSEVEAIPLWSLFSGYNLTFSISPESTRVSITPSCSAVQSILLPTACVINLSILHQLVFCVQFDRIAVYTYECSATNCSPHAIATFHSSQYEFEYFIDMKVLNELQSTILIVVTGCNQRDKQPWTRKRMIANYHINQRTLKTLYIEAAQVSLFSLFFVTESEVLRHLFIYGQNLSHYILAGSEKSDISVEKRLYREWPLASISSMSSVRERRQVQVFLLTTENELFSFRLNGFLSLLSTRSVSIIGNRKCLLHGQAIVCIDLTAIQVFSVFELRLINKIYLPQVVNLETFFQISSFEKPIVVMNTMQTKKMIIDLSVRGDSSVLCYYSSENVGFTATGVYRTRGRFLELVSISTPTLRIAPGDLTLNITAHNGAGQQATVTINVVRSADRRVIAMAGLAALCAVGAGCCWLCRRSERRGKVSEIELETSSLDSFP